MLILKNTSPRRCWLIGHRGAMGHVPENTMSSFRLAQKMGAELCECDVHLSKDKKCIVIHDESVERTTNGYGLIRDLSSNEIKKLDAGAGFSKKFKKEKVPLLKELLNWAREERSLSGMPMSVVIEIKNEPVRYFGIEEKVIATVKKAKMEDRVILISFDHGVVKRAKRLARNIATGILYNRPLENPVRRAREIGADAIFPRRNMVTKSLVQKAHSANLTIATWTVNKIWEMKKIIRCGVDAIATNFPDRLNKLFSS